MTRMKGPDCAVICNLINTHTHTHTAAAAAAAVPSCSCSDVSAVRRGVCCKLIATEFTSCLMVLLEQTAQRSRAGGRGGEGVGRLELHWQQVQLPHLRNTGLRNTGATCTRPACLKPAIFKLRTFVVRW